MILGESVYSLFMKFYIFAFWGWIYESAYVSVKSKKVVNRGFLIGPIIPIYGFGGVLIFLFLRPFTTYATLLYVMGMVIATALEYLVSVLLEKLFHARWWDYYNAPYNINGRIALLPSMFWGVLSLFMFDALLPAADAIIEAIPLRTGEILLAAGMLLTLADLTYTVITTVHFREQIEKLADFREELEHTLEEFQLPAMRDLIDAAAKDISEAFPLPSPHEMSETIYRRLEEIREGAQENASRAEALAERGRIYWEKRNAFLKKHPLLGYRRIMEAFPKMHVHTQNRSVEVKELLFKKHPRKRKQKENNI